MTKNQKNSSTLQGTFSLWIKPSWASTDTQDRYFYYNNWIKVFKNVGNLKFTYDTSNHAVVYNISSSGANWQTTNWYHVVARWNINNPVNGSNYAELYVNGSLVAQNTNTGTADTIQVRQFIGSDSGGQNQAAALIDDFAIFDRVLTTTEITNIYNSGTGREAGYVADASLKFYAKMDGSGTLSPVTYNAGANVDQTAYNSSTNTNGNMVTNGNMEAASAGAPTSWTAVASPTLADAEAANILYDTRSQKITNTAANDGISQTISSLTAGNDLYVSAWVKSDGTNAAKLACQKGSDSSEIISLTSTSSSWTKLDFACEVPAGQTSVKIALTAAGTTTVWYADGVHFTPNLVDNGGMEGGTSYLVSAWTKATSTNTAVLAFDAGSGSASNITTTTSTSYVRLSGVVKATGTAGVIYLRASANADVVWFDDVSVIPLDNTALSFQAWAPANDTASLNPLSIHGGTSGVSSNTSGKLNNAYTFDGSTGYLRQKTYLTNIGTLTYGTNALTDTGQTFTSYKATPATYMIVVTNSDNTTSWGYIGTTSGATIVDVFTTKALSVAGWNGTSPSGKTPVGYEVRKTDYQITGAITLGVWAKTGSNTWRGIFGKTGETVTETGIRSYLLYLDGSGYPSFSIGNSVKTIVQSVAFGDNNWHFLTAVYSPSNYMYLYKDGVLVASDLTSIPSSITDYQSRFLIGNWEASFWTGSIDSPFVLNTALTADQIAALYQYHSLATTNNSTISVINGSATPTNDTNYHTYLMTAGSASTTAASDNTVFETSSTNLPNEAVNLRLMNSDTTNALTVDWVAVAKQASTAPTVAAPATEEKGGAPVAYWKFDEGTGTALQGATISGATWQTEDQCVAGKCLYFDGTNDVVTVANSVAGVQSVSFWIRPITTTEQFIDLNGTAYISATAGALSASGFTSPTIYVNGAITSTIAASAWSYVTVTTDTAITANVLEIGRANSGYAGNGTKIDEVRIFNRTLSGREVRDLYNWAPSPRVYLKMEEGSGTSTNDDSGNARTGTLNGNPIWAPGKYGKGVKLDGTGDYVQVSDF